MEAPEIWIIHTLLEDPVVLEVGGVAAAALRRGGRRCVERPVQQVDLHLVRKAMRVALGVTKARMSCNILLEQAAVALVLQGKQVRCVHLEMAATDPSCHLHQYCHRGLQAEGPAH